MVPLQEYIQLSLTKEEKLIGKEIKEVHDATLLTHLSAANSMKIRALPIYTHLFEGSGLIDDCFSIAHAVAYNVDKVFKKEAKSFSLMFTKEFFDKNNINGVHFENLCVNITNINKPFGNGNKGEGEYGYDEADLLWNQETKTFGVITLSISIPYDYYGNKTSCVDIIAHEIRHYFEDYDDHCKGSDIATKRSKASKRFNKAEKDIVNNYLNKGEFASYLAQLDAEIGKRKFDDIKDACLWLKNHCDTWKIYVRLKKDIETYGTDKINKEFKKTWGKFVNHVSHILNDHISTSKTLREHCDQGQFLEFVNIKFDL